MSMGPTGRKLRVLVCEDSRLMRRLMVELLTAPDIEVVGEAAEPAEAREMIKALNPDVLTLDVEMPNMDGISFLEKIMRLRPMPVVMVSTLTQAGAETTLRALELGAVDFFPKPTTDVARTLSDQRQVLLAKIRAAGAARVRGPAARQTTQTTDRSVVPSGFSPGRHIVAIGASTGGVEALTAVISRLPANCAPTVVVQHMPPGYTASFAARLDRLSAPTVTEATENAPLQAGRVYIAPAGANHLTIVGDSGGVCRLVAGDPISGHRPSIDKLFASAAQVAGARGIGVILTGMGKDGADGLLQMRRAGAATVGQDEATSVIYGMPRVAFEIGAVERQAPLSRIASEIVSLCTAHERSRQHARAR